jgi:hypothetical protein
LPPLLPKTTHMQVKWMIPAIVAITLSTACGNTNDHQNHEGGKSMNEAAAPEMGATDLLFEEVVAFHDEAMPKMGKLKGYIKDVESKMDSLANLNDAASKKLGGEYASLLSGLKRAEKGMMDWMDDFQPEPDGISEDSLIAYYGLEKEKAKAMRDDIFTMLDSAAAKLGY